MSQAPNRFGNINSSMNPVGEPNPERSNSCDSNHELEVMGRTSVPEPMMFKDDSSKVDANFDIDNLLPIHNLKADDIDYQETQSEEKTPTIKLTNVGELGSFQLSEKKMTNVLTDDLNFNIGENNMARFTSPSFTQSVSLAQPAPLNRFMKVNNDPETIIERRTFSRAESMPVIYHNIEPGSGQVNHYYRDHVLEEENSMNSDINNSSRQINFGRFTIKDKISKNNVDQNIHDNEGINKTVTNEHFFGSSQNMFQDQFQLNKPETMNRMSLHELSSNASHPKELSLKKYESQTVDGRFETTGNAADALKHDNDIHHIPPFGDMVALDSHNASV